jgi:hypothetical protein
VTFTTVEYKKKKTPTTIIPKALPRTDREVIITLGEKVTNQATIADQALQAINKAIKESTDITQLPFILARITSNNRLVLTTNPTTKASDYTPYLQIIANVAQPLKLTETRINEQWTKFLLHNVPTNAELPAVRSEIEDTYPSLHLGQDPCWLVPTKRRTNKAASTLVISLIGSIDYRHLGISQLAICTECAKLTNTSPGTPPPNAATAKNMDTTPNYAKPITHTAQSAPRTTPPKTTPAPSQLVALAVHAPTPQFNMPTARAHTRHMTGHAPYASNIWKNTRGTQHLTNPWNPKHYE